MKDGVIASLFWYKESWYIVGIEEEQFMILWNQKGYQYPEDKAVCYTFNVTENDLIFISGRNMDTFSEYTLDELLNTGYETPEIVRFDTLENLVLSYRDKDVQSFKGCPRWS